MSHNLPPCSVAADIIPREAEECNGKFHRYSPVFLESTIPTDKSISLSANSASAIFCFTYSSVAKPATFGISDFKAYGVRSGVGIALIAASNSSLVANPLTSGMIIPKIASFNSFTALSKSFLYLTFYRPFMTLCQGLDINYKSF